jgi:acyl-ACP thioesterase
MIYTEGKKLSYNELDFKGLWKLENIFLTMQDVAGKHAEKLGAGYEDLKKKGITWVLIRTSLKMEKYPDAYTPVKITTWPEPEKRMLFPRFFTFQDDAGNLLGTASTLWALMDIEARTLVAPASKGIAVQTPAEPPLKLELPGKIKLPEGEIMESTICPKYSDLDINNHVNNSRYIDWFADQIPLEVHSRGILSEISVGYSKEIRSGESVKLEFSRNDNQFRMAGKEGDQVCFMVNATWKEEKL